MNGKWMALLFWIFFALVQTGCDQGEIDEDEVAAPPSTTPILALAPFSVREDSSNSFLFTLSRPSSQPVTFSWTISAIAVSPSSRFSALSGSVTIPAGVTAFPVAIPLVNDNIYQQNQDFRLSLSNVPAGVSLPSAQISFTLVDDEAPPVIRFSSAAQTVAEASGAATVEVELSHPSIFSTTIGFTTAGTATLNSDYSVSPSSSVTFAAGELSKSITVALINDSITEPDETAIFGLGLVMMGYATKSSTQAIHTLTIANDDFAPTVTQVNSTLANGYYGSGTIPITVQFSQAVSVTGSPVLTLETGATDRVATYASGSGTSNLIFNYVIQSGDSSTDLDYLSTTALSLNGGSIKSVADSLDANLALAAPGTTNSLSANKDLRIDTVLPTVTNVTSSSTNGVYSVGATLSVSMTFSKSVNVTGTPQLTLETGSVDRTVNYVSGTGSNTLTFTYVVQAGDANTDLDYASTSALSLNGGSIRDIASNSADLTLPVPGSLGSLAWNKNLHIDTTPATVASLGSTAGSGHYSAGALIPITVEFSEDVFVSGAPQLTLETGATDRVVNYSSGSGTSILVFNYVVQAGDTSSDLDVVATTSLGLNSGSIKDAAGNSAGVTLPAPGALQSLSANKSLVIDTTSPTAPSSIDDGTWSLSLVTTPGLTWGASIDATSGLDHYELAIGTSSGGTQTLGWTAVGTLTSKTQAGLNLTEGTVYYVSARAVDRAGNISSVVSGDGFRADVTAPTTPSAFDDGLTSSSTTDTPTLTWSAASDALSGLSRYQVAIGNSSAETDVLDWTDVSLVTSKVMSGLTLTEGSTYYASVRAVDQAGNVGSPKTGDGWVIGWLQEAYLKAANAGANDKYGSVVSISGDTMVVGSPYEASSQTSITNGPNASTSNGATASGAVYVYVRSGNAWTQQAYIKAPNGRSNALFGSSVSISGDTVVVGAPGESCSNTGVSTSTFCFRYNVGSSGAAYVFTRSGATWSFQSFFKADNASSNELFGSSVSISGDTVVVGAPMESSNATGPRNATAGAKNTNGNGAAYVYSRSGSSWTLSSYLKSPIALASQRFGASVAVSDTTVLVGAPGESSSDTGVANGTTGSSNTSSASSGAAYVFKKGSSAWAQEAYIKPTLNSANIQFGSSVALDLDTAVVGVPNESANAGSAYVYERSGSAWAIQSYLQAGNAETGAFYGSSVAVSGNFILIGSPGESTYQTTVTQGPDTGTNSSAPNAGAAYLYRKSGSMWPQLAYLKAPNAESGDTVGTSVSLSGSSLAVGAHGEDSNQQTITNGQTASAANSAADAGAVYLFNR